ncbi:MAG: metallophosphoesterase [Flavobacteriaceae bacterium]|nr:metallophosphoesterase [Flavobacteriaceae bacterium]|tara:strand:+ start:291 stop:1313 length:1023 start_codon:yes stop_codon:yes gene_type:complete
MKRRSFIKETTTVFTGIGLSTVSCTQAQTKKGEEPSEVYVTMDQEKVFFHSDVIKEKIKIIHIADTHLYMDDDRGIPFLNYSNRMAKAYNQTIHFKTREKTNPKKSFQQALEFAKELNADVITLIGDIFSFPSELAIEWVLSKLKAIGIPYIYIAGNHDWHYEGMKGSLDSLRDKWIEKRLMPLYQGNNPLMAAYDIKGIRFLAIDNSTYEINDEQLIFFSEQVASGLPLVLLVHIPMYAPGKKISFGCGNPFWGAKTDRNFKLERRPKWPENGHTKTTFEFYKKVFNSSNVMGIFAGHIHRNSIEIIKGKPQIVSDDNANGAYLDIDFMPLEEKHKNIS